MVRLQWRLNGQQDVEKTKVRLIEKEEHDRVADGEDDGGPCRPAVEREDIELAMGPLANRAVAHRHEDAEQKIEACCSCRSEAEIGTKIQQGHARRRSGRQPVLRCQYKFRRGTANSLANRRASATLAIHW